MNPTGDELGLHRARSALSTALRRIWRRRWPPVTTALCLLSLALALLAAALWALSTHRIDTLSLASRGPTRVSAQTAPDGTALYDFDQTEFSAISFHGTVILRRSEATLEAWTLGYLQRTNKLSSRVHHTVEPFDPAFATALPRWHLEPPIYILMGIGFYHLPAERDFGVYLPWWLITGALLIAPSWGAWRLLRNPHDCPRCGYSRAGLAPAAPCPECGAASTPAR
jgi:hypothetical protein